MHPMMGLAALHGLVAMRLWYSNDNWRVTKVIKHGYPAIHFFTEEYGEVKYRVAARIGTQSYESSYRPAELADIPDRYWDVVTEEMLEGLLCIQ